MDVVESKTGELMKMQERQRWREARESRERHILRYRVRDDGKERD